LFTPPTRTRQDRLVLSCPCRRCEQDMMGRGEQNIGDPAYIFSGVKTAQIPWPTPLQTWVCEIN